MKFLPRIRITISLLLLFLGAWLAFAEADNFSLKTKPIFDELGFASVDLPALVPSSNNKIFDLTAVFFSDSERDHSVFPATLEQLLNAIELNDIERAERLLIG